ncbi:hypothetical protein ACH0CM_29635 [Streptomyces albus]|uniref:hypothetical protein n=1 Tax=Streptomyces albus TaxID=1888 RepID=UPI003879B893
MIQHMNLVFQAGGLNTGEGAFLMACCNHTDDHGYVIASMRQLADEAHMKERTARENKQRLIKRGLLAAAERRHPKTGARIADLYRVNLKLLASMKRERTDYGPTVIEELTFAEPEETAGQPPRRNPPPPPADSAAPPADSAAPPADSAAPPADSAGDVGADSAPLLLPSSSPSSLPPATADPGNESGTEADGGEREAATPQSAADVVVDAYARALGRPLLNGSRKALRAQVVELLAAGYPVEWVADRAREMAEHPEWKDLVKHADRSRVPIPGQASRGQSGGGRERCPDHPARYRRGCAECALAVPD